MTADPRVWLGQLADVHGKATGGVWKLWGMSVMADQDGTSNVDTAVPVAQTYFRDEAGKPRTFDATFIAEAHAKWPALLAVVTGVLDLADDWDRTAAIFPEYGDLSAAAARSLRAVVAAATEEGK